MLGNYSGSKPLKCLMQRGGPRQIKEVLTLGAMDTVVQIRQLQLPGSFQKAKGPRRKLEVKGRSASGPQGPRIGLDTKQYIVLHNRRMYRRYSRYSTPQRNKATDVSLSVMPLLKMYIG